MTTPFERRTRRAQSRLADAGVETVADLAEADTADLADESGISEKRISDWQEAARERLG